MSTASGPTVTGCAQNLSRAAAGLYLGTATEEQVREIEERLAGVEGALRRAEAALRYL